MKELTSREEDFSQWYRDLVLEAKLADYGLSRGTMVIRPYGFSIWENIKRALDGRIKKAGVSNAYFPLFVPLSNLEKEKEHVEGFSPELAVVTHGGGKKLEEPLAVRPTSETIIYDMYRRWIHSWRDLPLKINQWANVVRWEKKTRLFLRTTEFLWQEGHTVHATHEEAKKEVQRALNMYKETYREELAMAGVGGRKSEAEKFPGALATYTYESLMPDGKALQSCTSHDLGQKFSKPFGITFQDKKGEARHPWQTCWGFSTRALGGLIMMHGDDKGLVLPPRVAPIQAVIVPIFGEENRGEVLRYGRRIRERLEGVRVEMDDSTRQTPGWKFNEYELKGVPLRIEVGPEEVEEKTLTVVSRPDGKERSLKKEEAEKRIKELLGKIQARLLRSSEERLEKGTRKVGGYEEFKRVLEQKGGFVRSFWCGDRGCEEKIKEETGATTRLRPSQGKKEGECVYCSRKSEEEWLFARAY